jgi:cytochrome c
MGLCLLLALTGLVSVTPSNSRQAETRPLSQEEAKHLKNPLPFTKSSIARGRTLFAHHCTGCHGTDGKALIDVIADATDLTEPKLWKSGTTVGEIYRSISDGAGLNMPPYKNQIGKGEDLWHLVNYIRSLWPDSSRPKLEEEKSTEGPSQKGL